MSARLIEVPEDEYLGGKDPLAGAAAPTSADDPKTEKAPTVDEDVLLGDDIPEKYRGKKAKDLLDVVINQESLIGRQSQEVGALRQETASLRGLVDKALQFKGGAQGQPTEQKPKPISGDDILRRPEEAVGQVVGERTKPLEERLERLEVYKDAVAFESKHPNAAADMNDEKFVAWVKASPYRDKLARKAFQGGKENIDWDAADELWTGYDELRNAAPAHKEEATVTQADKSQKQTPSIEDVSLLKTGGGAAREQPGARERFKRSALEHLQATNPDSYWSPEVQRRIFAGIVVDD